MISAPASNVDKTIIYGVNHRSLTRDDKIVSKSNLDKSILQVFDVKNSMNTKKSHGGTSVINVKSMIKKYKREIK